MYYGVVPNKSFTASVSPELQNNKHFWKGMVCGDGGVSFDQFCHNTAGRLQAHRQWGHIKKQEVLNL